MSSIWWLDADHKQVGPIEATKAIGLVKTGQIKAETLVWSEGMATWAPAREAPTLGEQFKAPPLPAAAGAPAAVVAAAASEATSIAIDAEAHPLHSSVTVWGLFWRSFVVMLGSLLVVPSPWTAAMYYRYLATTTHGPDGRGFEFEGKALDIWWVFVLLGVFPGLQLTANAYAPDLSSMVSFAIPFAEIALVYLALRWFVSKVRPYGLTLEFKGGFWPYLGLYLLLIVSFVTIIGWAWAGKYFADWISRNIVGGARLEFRGSAFGLLWRGFVAMIASMFILPIPWVFSWIVRWTVSQIYISAPR